MPASNVISLGIGSPSRIEHLVTLGLDARANVLLVGGETGYAYPAPSGAIEPMLEVEAATGTEPTYTYGS